jgi:hypothetical protein
MTITLAQYQDFYSRFHGANGGKITVHGGKKRNNDQRMGQMFINEFFKNGEVDSELFNVVDWHEANALIFRQYVEPAKQD